MIYAILLLASSLGAVCLGIGSHRGTQVDAPEPVHLVAFVPVALLGGLAAHELGRWVGLAVTIGGGLALGHLLPVPARWRSEPDDATGRRSAWTAWRETAHRSGGLQLRIILAWLYWVVGPAALLARRSLRDHRPATDDTAWQRVDDDGRALTLDELRRQGNPQ